MNLIKLLNFNHQSNQNRIVCIFVWENVFHFEIYSIFTQFLSVFFSICCVFLCDLFLLLFRMMNKAKALGKIYQIIVHGIEINFFVVVVLVFSYLTEWQKQTNSFVCCAMQILFFTFCNFKWQSSTGKVSKRCMQLKT